MTEGTTARFLLSQKESLIDLDNIKLAKGFTSNCIIASTKNPSDPHWKCGYHVYLEVTVPKNNYFLGGDNAIKSVIYLHKAGLYVPDILHENEMRDFCANTENNVLVSTEDMCFETTEHVIAIYKLQRTTPFFGNLEDGGMKYCLRARIYSLKGSVASMNYVCIGSCVSAAFPFAYNSKDTNISRCILVAAEREYGHLSTRQSNEVGSDDFVLGLEKYSTHTPEWLMSQRLCSSHIKDIIINSENEKKCSLNKREISQVITTSTSQNIADSPASHAEHADFINLSLFPSHYIENVDLVYNGKHLSAPPLALSLQHLPTSHYLTDLGIVLTCNTLQPLSLIPINNLHQISGDISVRSYEPWPQHDDNFAWA